MIMIDTPFNDVDITPERVAYVRGQFDEAIRQLEVISGRKFDPERLKEVMQISSKNAKLWKKSMSPLRMNCRISRSCRR